MKKFYCKMLSLVALMFVSVAAMAQHKVEIAEPEKGDYATTNTTFSLSEIAAELGVTKDELVAAFETWHADGAYSGTPEFFES